MSQPSSEPGEIPARRRRTYVSRTEFAEVSARMPTMDVAAFRSDLDRYVDDEAYDPYRRAYGHGDLGPGEE